MKLKTLKQMLTKIMDEVRDNTNIENLSDKDIVKLIEHALYEMLNPPKKSVKDRILPKVSSQIVDSKDLPFKSRFKNSHCIAITDDRDRHDTIIRVDFDE